MTCPVGVSFPVSPETRNVTTVSVNSLAAYCHADVRDVERHRRLFARWRRRLALPRRIADPSIGHSATKYCREFEVWHRLHSLFDETIPLSGAALEERPHSAH